MAGRVVAGVSSMAVCTLVAGYFAFVLAVAIAMGNYQEFMLSLVVLMVVTNGYAAVALVTPASRRWFAACRAVRRSYRRP